MLTRKSFLKVMAASGVSAYVVTRGGMVRIGKAAQSPQIPLNPKTIPQFVDPLPDLDIITAGTEQIELQMTEFQTNVLPNQMNLPTWVWGYLQPGEGSRTSYLGPVIVATRGTPTEIKFVNNLGGADTTNVLAYKYSTDETLHWADPLNNEENMLAHMANPPSYADYAALIPPGFPNYSGPVPAVVHLHGGEVPSVLDGGPNAWFTSDNQYVGAGYYSKDGLSAKNYAIYRYPNTQEGAPIWFHDHTLGATRLNVFCGLAGAYLIVDPANDPANLPPLIPLVIQDRMFDTNGQWFFPADSAGGVLWALNPQHPYWVPEFIGDVICVNGKAWPKLDVEQKRYTFFFLNGSNARSYEMYLIDPISGNRGPTMWFIGTDGGYLDAPVPVGPISGSSNRMVIMPGERYLAIIDFAGYQAGVIGPNGQPYSGHWVLKNTAKAPYPGGASPQGATTAQIMQFNVTTPPTSPDTTFNPATPGVTVRPTPMVRLVDPVAGVVASGVTVNKTRQLTLNEIALLPQNAIDPVTGLMTAYPGGPVEILVNNTKWDGMRIVGTKTDNSMLEWDMVPIPGFTLGSNGTSYLSELPMEGETEIWEIVNLTMDAHPIHTHLVQFQLMNRQNFDMKAYMADYALAFPSGYDYTLKANVGPGAFIPAFGPPLDYATGNARALGGNPDIAATGARGKPLYLKGAPMPPLAHEAGWKDVVMVLPGMVTRFVVRWAPTDLPASTPAAKAWFKFDPNDGNGYVWHCHIVDHEDNEMMRPDEVMPNPNAPSPRDYIKGEAY